MQKTKVPDLSIKLTPGLCLSNPVMTASGTFGYGIESSNLIDIQCLGAIICKGTTIKPRKGNKQPRIVETPSGMLNSIGLQNIGIDALIKEKAPVWAKWHVPVIVNICGETKDEYVELAKRLNDIAGVSGLEVNISCPNVDKGCMEFGANPEAAYDITSAVKAATSLPVIIKLTPNTSDIVAVAIAVENAGADAISLINTLMGMSIDTGKRKPVLANVTGGLSGPAIKPIALYIVYKVAKAVKIPLIGCGGIASTNDALEFIMAGASAIQIGTVSMVNPTIFIQIIDGINAFMYKRGIYKLDDIIGIAS